MTWYQRRSPGNTRYFVADFMTLHDGSATFYCCVPQEFNPRRWDAQITCCYARTPEAARELVKKALEMTAEHAVTSFLSVLCPHTKEALYQSRVQYYGERTEYQHHREGAKYSIPDRTVQTLRGGEGKLRPAVIPLPLGF